MKPARAWVLTADASAAVVLPVPRPAGCVAGPAPPPFPFGTRLGLAVFLGVTTPLWRPGQHAFTTIAIGVLGGLLMAATTSAVTAVALRRLPGLR
ncbi:hypothetical protein ACGFMK_24850 [Amycolatopsis sp. NPDC049252]|uniref:hypothetical protein n=1 Tax=Amycolatopsis sp. NPDC049252 TaxID=3363933 RepID=UPI00372175E9